MNIRSVTAEGHEPLEDRMPAGDHLAATSTQFHSRLDEIGRDPSFASFATASLVSVTAKRALADVAATCQKTTQRPSTHGPIEAESQDGAAGWEVEDP